MLKVVLFYCGPVTLPCRGRDHLRRQTVQEKTLQLWQLYTILHGIDITFLRCTTYYAVKCNVFAYKEKIFQINWRLNLPFRVIVIRLIMHLLQGQAQIVLVILTNATRWCRSYILSVYTSFNFNDMWKCWAYVK